ncbi:MAG TPA: autotransporter assembly complex family protein [Stellaceae bacterium]|nr:autotransporter assembly complex family protein [Stellaceae bacterium]
MLSLGVARAEVPYAVDITGIEDDQVKDDVEATSQLVKLKDRPPASIAALRRRADDDMPRLKQVVEAAGYRAAAIDYAIDEAASPVKVTVKVTPGPLYQLETVTLQTPDGGTPPGVDTADTKELGLELGGPASSAPVLAAEPKIVDLFAQHGRPFAKVSHRRVVVDHGTRTMSVTYTVEPGPTAKFGAVSVEGVKSVGLGYVENRIAWRRGAAFDSRDVEKTRKALVESGLFNTVRIVNGKEAADGAEVPMTIYLTERQPRSIGAGIAYNTSQGFGANTFWEHRNLFGNAEKLRLSADFAQSRLGLVANYRQPDFLRKDTDLLGTAELADDTPIAYSSRRERLFSGLESRLWPLVIGGAGLQFEHANVTEEARHITQTYSLAGVPIFLRRDSTDDLLNPTTGTRASATVTPYTSVSGRSLTFASSRLSGSAYRKLGSGDRFTLAGFGALGSIVGESRDDLPADKRLYAGGGGSLRGYGYQLAGPINGDHKPFGGRSLLEFGTELRVKITEAIGIVPFLEAGNVYDQSYPKLASRLLYDTGIGVRYYTPVGPVRFDVATPLSRRQGDALFQIYVSLGQAF